MLSNQTAAELRHTLRTPLNHISGYSEILLEDLGSLPGYTEAARLLHAIREDSIRNLEAIQNVLSGDAGSLPVDASAALQRQMSLPLRRIEMAGEALETMLPPEMLPDLSRIRGATRELAGEIESPRQFSPPRSPAQPAAEKLPDLLPGSASILVVDDNEGNRDMLSRRLTRSGYSVTLAESGQLALDHLRQTPCDLVLLDLVMPGMNGLEVIEIVKSDADLCHTPVILISALDDMETVAKCIELGAEDYLFKPVNPTLLRARVRSTLERKRAEQAIRRKQELESIGALAAGVAHDFNNLLTGVLGNACMLRDNLPPGGSERYFAEEIIKSSERAADLTRQLLAYSGKGSYKREAVDLSALVTDSASLIRTLIPAMVEIRWELASVPAVNGDVEQLRQLILNLITNAGEAVGAEPGSVIIATGLEDSSHEPCGDDYLLGDPAPGAHVYLEIRDTGHGIDPAAVANIFAPFYTTKFFGRGLGLAAVAGIVRMHRGGLRVSTAQNKGSSFRVLLPMAEAPQVERAGILEV